jgi:regulator of RNase E activity RraB
MSHDHTNNLHDDSDDGLDDQAGDDGSNWTGYMFETDDGPASCLFNLAAAEFAPDPDRKFCVMVRVPFKEPGEHGLGESEERDTLAEFEEALDASGALHDSIHFASVRGNGHLDIWYYATLAGADALAKAAPGACPGYDVEVARGEDPEWQQFGLLFPSDEDVAAYADDQLIAQLEAAGDQIDKPRPVDHALLVETTAAGEKLRDALIRKGFTVQPITKAGGDDDGEDGDEGPVEGDLNYLVEATKRHAVTPEVISEIRRELTELVEDMGGAYDGWQTPLVKG